MASEEKMREILRCLTPTACIGHHSPKDVDRDLLNKRGYGLRIGLLPPCGYTAGSRTKGRKAKRERETTSTRGPRKLAN